MKDFNLMKDQLIGTITIFERLMDLDSPPAPACLIETGTNEVTSLKTAEGTSTRNLDQISAAMRIIQRIDCTNVQPCFLQPLYMNTPLQWNNERKLKEPRNSIVRKNVYYLASKLQNVKELVEDENFCCLTTKNDRDNMEAETDNFLKSVILFACLVKKSSNELPITKLKEILTKTGNTETAKILENVTTQSSANPINVQIVADAEVPLLEGATGGQDEAAAVAMNAAAGDSTEYWMEAVRKAAREAVHGEGGITRGSIYTPAVFVKRTPCPTPAPEDEWSCQHCTFLNAKLTTVCGMCYKSKDFKTMKVIRCKTASVCGDCTFYNESDAEICEVCGSDLPYSTTAYKVDENDSD